MEKEKHQWERNILSIASFMSPDQGPNLRPSHVPWPVIEVETLHFAGLLWSEPIEPQGSEQYYILNITFLKKSVHKHFLFLSPLNAY